MDETIAMERDEMRALVEAVRSGDPVDVAVKKAAVQAFAMGLSMAMVHEPREKGERPA